MKERLIDLSHTIEDGMITYKGLPAPVICDYWTREQSSHYYEEGTTFQIGKIEMVANTGTYLDAPFHRFENGKDLSELDLTGLAGLPAVLIDVSGFAERAIGPEHFKKVDLKGKAVLVRTDWSRHWRTDRYFEGHPFLTEESAIFLRDAGARLVGIDSYNIDDTEGRTRPVHSVLLGAEILIAEHLTHLSLVPQDTPMQFFAVPPKIKGMGTFPVRAYVKVGEK